jgi:hypothetical protein
MERWRFVAGWHCAGEIVELQMNWKPEITLTCIGSFSWFSTGKNFFLAETSKALLILLALMYREMYNIECLNLAIH